MPLKTNYKKLKSLTLNYNSLTTEHISKINDIVKSVIDKKTDEYWKNYTNYKINDQTAITLLLDNDVVVAFSSIVNKKFYGDDVYRIFNRFLIKSILVSGLRETPTFFFRSFILFIEASKLSVASGCTVIISAPASA